MIDEHTDRWTDKQTDIQTDMTDVLSFLTDE